MHTQVYSYIGECKYFYNGQYGFWTNNFPRLGLSQSIIQEACENNRQLITIMLGVCLTLCNIAAEKLILLRTYNGYVTPPC